MESRTEKMKTSVLIFGICCLYAAIASPTFGRINRDNVSNFDNNTLLLCRYFIFKVSYLQDILRITRDMGNNRPTDTCVNYANFSELNDDCKLLILEQLDLISLVNMAEVDENLHALAEDVYRRKYSTNSLHFYAEIFWGNNVKISGDFIFTKDLSIFAKIVKQFGHLITDLKFDYTNNASEAVSLANRHCNNLQSFYISSHSENVLTEVAKSFNSVKTVIFAGEIGKLSSKTMQLNEMFPKLQSLSIKHSNFDWDSLILEYPHLEHLKIWTSSTMNETAFERLLKLNPQIRSLSVNMIPHNVFSFINKQLPKLENLELSITSFLQSSEPINFKSVRNLTVTFSPQCFPENVTFEQLSELRVFWMPTPMIQWLAFIRRHSTLRKLYFVSMTNGILNAIENVPNIEQVSFFMQGDTSVASIIQFLERNENINTLSIQYRIHSNDTKRQLADFRNQIQGEWDVTESTETFLFEKKV